MKEPGCHCDDPAWGTCPRHGKKVKPAQCVMVGPEESLTEEQLANASIRFVTDEHTGFVPRGESAESVLQEAHRLTHGPRQKDYGHPLDDYTRTAALVSALLAHKLKEPIAPHEMALAMVCVKLSRQINAPKRDNMVDGAGYCWVSQECLDEAARRNK